MALRSGVLGSKVKLFLLLCGAALVTLPAGSWVAHAHTQQFKSNLSLHYVKKDNSFDGHVGTASFCQEGRHIQIHEQSSGTVVGSAVSGHAGQWGPVPAASSGTFYATVDAESRGGYGHDHECEAGTSKSVTVP